MNNKGVSFFWLTLYSCYQQTFILEITDAWTK
jgi:hypothetical protein